MNLWIEDALYLHRPGEASDLINSRKAMIPTSEVESTASRSLRAVLLAIVLGVSLTACPEHEQQHAGQSAAIDTAAIGASLDSLAAAVTRANQTGDAELFASTWAEDGVMSAPGTPPVRGRDAIVADFRRRPPLPAGATMTIHPSEIRVLSPEWAYAFGVDSLTYTPEGAAEPVKETSTFLVLVRKTSEGWQTYREVLSANQPLRAAQQ